MRVVVVSCFGANSHCFSTTPSKPGQPGTAGIAVPAGAPSPDPQNWASRVLIDYLTRPAGREVFKATGL